MKKNKYFLKILIISYILFPIKILALGSIDIDNTNLEIIKGNKETVNIKLNNAAGRIDINTMDSDVVSISNESIFLDNSQAAITFNGIDVGNTTITIYAYDVTTYDSESLTGKIYTISASVIDMGDIDKDGKIALNDVIVLIKKYLGIFSITADDLLTGDMDKNGIIGINDVILLLKTYIGLD